MTIIQDRVAVTDVPVLDVFAERWSTRVFDPELPLDEEAFASALEAARWAPSANNSQPWRAIVARRGTSDHESLMSHLLGFNQGWAGSAAALVVFVAETETEDGTGAPWAIYDTGQAAAFFTIQAHAADLATHQMGGFDRDGVSAAFGLDARFTPIAVMAVGAFGDSSDSPEFLRDLEAAPRTRRPVADSLLRNA
ncbi:nitroreductase [Microbacterium endophyticum]|uniref:Nitroreductase n=1 Tax=Microbacterium endophyticum TaxID=1526412 RepID=A0A7W4V5F6_9MICO|nr:nitroreductase family protein [Microbacterium endophyticum]MBB2976849.1 nitroreductase [Microbacterium endophyticum]NIK35833.1 nitroreductase [Microbacterium endophyticum]